MTHKARPNSGEGSVGTSQLPDLLAKESSADFWASTRFEYGDDEDQSNSYTRGISCPNTKRSNLILNNDSIYSNLTNDVQDTLKLPHISTLSGNSLDNVLPTETPSNPTPYRSILRDIWANPLPQVDDEIFHEPSAETSKYTLSPPAQGSADGTDEADYSAIAHCNSDASSILRPSDHGIIDICERDQFYDTHTNQVSLPPNLLVTQQDEVHVPVTGTGRGIMHEQDTKSSGPISKVWNIPRRTRNRKHRPSKDKHTTTKFDHDRVEHHRPQTGKKPRHRGAFTDNTLRGMTALTRELKSCIRCRIQRNRCRPDDGNPSGPCLTCLGMSSRKISHLPCLRWIITDACIYREQQAPYQGFTKRWQTMDIVDISNWASDEVRTIHVSQTFLEAPYTIEVKKFIPQEGDLVEERWTVDGRIKRHQVPQYAISNMGKHAEDLQSFINKNVGLYIRGAVGNEDDLLWQTYFTAFKHAHEAKTMHERNLLQNLFRFWVALCKTSNVHHICGDDKLGGEPVTDPQSPWYNLVPMPAVIIAQKECIIYTKIFRPLSKKILRDLQHLILSNKRHYWLTIYLSIFILMHSCAMITRRDEETARQYNLRERFANPAGIAAHHSAAQTMLAHFNYINSGFRPFQLVLEPFGTEEVREAGQLNDAQVKFVQMTALWVRNNDTLLQQIVENNNSSHTYYWISQIYQNTWKPGPIG